MTKNRDNKDSVPTAEAVFGPNPWVQNPTGQVLTTGAVYNYNPYYFATAEAAQRVADMVGGKVMSPVYGLAQFGPFTQSHPNLMIKMPDKKDTDGAIIKKGVIFNAGLFMSFWDHGWTQSYIDLLVKSELEE